MNWFEKKRLECLGTKLGSPAGSSSAGSSSAGSSSDLVEYKHRSNFLHDSPVSSARLHECLNDLKIEDTKDTYARTRHYYTEGAKPKRSILKKTSERYLSSSLHSKTASEIANTKQSLTSRREPVTSSRWAVKPATQVERAYGTSAQTWYGNLKSSGSAHMPTSARSPISLRNSDKASPVKHSAHSRSLCQLSSATKSTELCYKGTQPGAERVQSSRSSSTILSSSRTDALRPRTSRTSTHQKSTASALARTTSNIIQVIARQRLPICEHKQNIMTQITGNRVTCIQGETGCGKSTMVPLFILEHYLKTNSTSLHHAVSRRTQPRILVTQPRRLAAKNLAKRVAELLDEEMGETVGYKISREIKVSSSTQVTYLTTGYLLQILVNNPESFTGYSHVILDEVHERRTDSDLLSLVVKLCMEKCTNTKVIVMSATLQGDLFSRYFSGADIYCNHPPTPIFVGAKLYDIKEFYLEDILKYQMGTNMTAEDIFAILKAQVVFDFPDKRQVLSSPGLNRLKHFDQRKILSSRPRGNGCPAPIIEEGLLKVCITLIKAVGQPGETILVFLPGIVEIQELYDKLDPLERKSQQEERKYRLFVLHSQIPQDEQGAAFKEPPADTVHVILATNIAESSLTLPKVRVVIDYGLRKQLLYDSKCKMTSLQNKWISQASACQRKGRTGRVFDGMVLRMFTRTFYQKLDEFDQPEMETSPLDKLVLKVKYIGRKIAPGETVSELLAQAVQPPKLDQLDEAIERLADVGALTDNNERADITLLGQAAISLPLDLLQCRLVVYGVLFGCACDAIVMAASMQLRMEPFSLPCLMIMKDVRKFLSSLKRSFQARVGFDEGFYSEPMMMRNVMQAWLQEVTRSGNKDTSEIHNSEEKEIPAAKSFSGRSRKTGITALRREFCRNNGLDAKRFRDFENSVADISSRLARFLPEDGDAYRQVSALMRLLYTEQEGEEAGAMFGDDSCLEDEDGDPLADDSKTIRTNAKCLAPPRLAQYDRDPTNIFSKESLIVQSLLVASFSPCYVVGTCFDEMKQGGPTGFVNKSERTAKVIQTHGLDPKRTIVLNNILASNNSMLKGNRDVVMRIVSLTCEPDSVEVERTGDRVFLQFSSDPFMPQRMSLVNDIPFPAHILHQFGAGRNRFEVPLERSSIAFKLCQRDQLTFDRPVQPYRVHWEYRHQIRKETEECTRVMRGYCKGHRNPVGFMCDTRGKYIVHYAVVAKTQGMSGSRNAECLMENVTVLPSERDGIFAKIMMLTFTSQKMKLEFLVTTKGPTKIKAVNLSGFTLQFTNANPLRIELLPIINGIRREMSKVFQQQQVGRIQIPDSGVKAKLSNLFEAVQRESTDWSRDSSPCVAISPFAQQDTSRSTEFQILEPFDLIALHQYINIGMDGAEKHAHARRRTKTPSLYLDF